MLFRFMRDDHPTADPILNNVCIDWTYCIYMVLYPMSLFKADLRALLRVVLDRTVRYHFRSPRISRTHIHT